MKPNLFNSEKVLLTDGGVGTEYFQRGIPRKACLELLNLTYPDLVQEVITDYIEAGADIVSTNTFGGNFSRLQERGQADKIEKINKQAVTLAREAAGDNHLLGLSIGPSGFNFLSSKIDSTMPCISSYENQFNAIDPEMIDLVMIETMTSLAETVLILKMVKKHFTNIPVSAAMVFIERAPLFETPAGESIKKAAKTLLDNGADFIGANCCSGIDEALAIVSEFKKVTDAPLIIQPSAGLPYERGGQLIYPETSFYFAGKMPELLEKGVHIVGGCCGTTPEHIIMMRNVIDK